MNFKTLKWLLSLILGASTLLSACDNKENTSTQVEKAVRIPASTEKAESTVEKSKELVAETKIQPEKRIA